MKKFKKSFLFLFLIFSIHNIFGQDAKESIYNFFADILIFETRGVSSNPDIEKFSGISKMPSIIFSCVKWNEGCQCGSLFDFYIPEYAGFLDSFVSYNSVDDDAKWMRTFFDGTIQNLKVSRPKDLDESEKEIKNMLLNEQNNNNELETLVESNKIELSSEKNNENKNIVERRLRNSTNMLSLYSYGDEIFNLQNTKDGYVRVISYKNKMKRQYYDEKMRLLKKEFWDLSGGISSSRKIKTELYEYEGSLIPISSRILEKNSRLFLKYDEIGHIIESLNYKSFNDSEKEINNKKTDEKESENKKDNKFILDSKTTWKYSESGNLLEKYCISYEYKNDSSSIVTGKNSKKDVYEYIIQDGQPDYFYYENDILRLKTVFSDINSYITTSFFDGNFVVESHYVESKHIKDLYYVKGRLRRTVLYE